MKFLGVSRSGYLAWLHHVPSDTEKRREAVKAKIQDIYDDSKQNYGAPKITVELRKTGEVISERTVGTYMRQMGIRAQWSKPWTITTKILISAQNYKISLMNSLILTARMLSGVRISPTSGQ